MKIHHEPHPVTPERKAELRAQGFKIIDARFKPLDLVEAVGADAYAIQAKEQAEAATEAAPPPLDHDGDGKPGGSLPDAVKPRRRGRPKKDT